MVTKNELVALLGISVPTLNQMLQRYGDRFPVSRSGRQGLEWQFDPDAVVAFLEAEKVAEQAADKDHLGVLDRLKSEISVEPTTKNLSPSELLKLAQLASLNRRELVANGSLRPTSEVRALLTDALTRLSRDFNSAVVQPLRDMQVPEVTIRSIIARLDDEKRRIVADLKFARIGIDPANPE